MAKFGIVGHMRHAIFLVFLAGCGGSDPVAPPDLAPIPDLAKSPADMVIAHSCNWALSEPQLSGFTDQADPDSGWELCAKPSAGQLVADIRASDGFRIAPWIFSAEKSAAVTLPSDKAGLAYRAPGTPNGAPETCTEWTGSISMSVDDMTWRSSVNVVCPGKNIRLVGELFGHL
jgi:hypothetical protein